MGGGRKLSDEEVIQGMQKFIDKGNVVGCLFENKLYGMLNVYCNFVETGDAYLNNVEVLKEYRGLGLSKGLLRIAYDIVKEYHFNSVSLDVAEDNTVAIGLYKKEGFFFTGNKREYKGQILLEMNKIL